MKEMKPLEVFFQKEKNKKYPQIALVVILALSLVTGYLGYTWHRHQRIEEAERLQVVRAVAALLHIEHLQALSLEPEEGDPAKELVEESLVQLVEESDAIYYAYILKEEDGSTKIVADSKAAKSETSRPIRKTCEGADINEVVFETGQSMIAEPIATPCGEWIRALVPVYDNDKKDIIAVLGLNYSATEWNTLLRTRMMPDIVIAIFLLILMIMSFCLMVINVQHKQSKEAVEEKENQVKFLRDHDGVTGLYNLERMEREKKRLDQTKYMPLSIAICDIDGLRIVNDAYGYGVGNQLIKTTGDLIKGCLEAGQVLGHIGGGEFLILLPKVDDCKAHQIKLKIKKKMEDYNKNNAESLYSISLSVGHGTKVKAQQKIENVYKDAKDYLNRRKLLNQNSSHSEIVSSIMATLYAKSQETEEHGQRLSDFCKVIGESLGLPQQELDDLQLVSKLHDIGKIGIDDSILNKPGKLTEEEWKIMKQHPEIGCSIAMATPQLQHIAEYILYHHEYWNGHGYPAGLMEEEIPIVARILSVADAYDAMTEDRIYRKALPKEVALEELERNAGSQFDPAVVVAFGHILRGE